MSNKRARKKQALERARTSLPYAPGGALQYVPAGVQQSPYGATFYGNTLKNLPVSQTALFSPGAPLPTQQGVNPLGLPVQFLYPQAVNSFPVDRTLQKEDIPSFMQLRRLAHMDYGIALCEQFILRMVLKLKLKISLTPEAIAGGAEEKNFQDEIKYFRNKFDKPDNNISIHEWAQQALIEQTQIDELYIYRNRTRRGELIGLEIIDGAQMKPLLDDWGRLPAPPRYAYQQYPWGIPGALYTTDQMIHRRETPATDTPYGRSRVERVIYVTNLALKKIKQDMAYFKRNIPAGILMPPGDSQWTPDQLDAYQQSFDAMLAGNLDLLSSIRVVQPGFTYTPFQQPSLDGIIDRFWLNIRASAYNIPMDSLGFTETSNRSTGQMQKDVLYEQTIGPFVAVYEAIFTDCMQNDFEPSMHGDMLQAEFTGYEPPEDEQAKATTLTTYTNAGILGLSDAAKLANLPTDPGAPQIGRVVISPTSGPIFLDDVAEQSMRDAQKAATLAGYQMAANPPDPAQPDGNNPDGAENAPQAGQKTGKGGQQAANKKPVARMADVREQVEALLRTLIGEEYEQRPYENAEVAPGLLGDSRGGDSEDARSTAADDTGQAGEHGRDSKEIAAEYRRWYSCAIKDVKAGKPVRHFVSEIIPQDQQESLRWSLSLCRTPETVRAVFPAFHEQPVLERDTSPKAEAASSNGGNQQQSKSDWKLRW